jgi:hypothetical protein
MVLDHGLCAGKFVERRETFFTSVTAFAHATKGQLDAGTRAEAIDEDLPGSNSLRHTNLAAAIFSPHSRN